MPSSNESWESSSRHGDEGCRPGSLGLLHKRSHGLDLNSKYFILFSIHCFTALQLLLCTDIYVHEVAQSSIIYVKIFAIRYLLSCNGLQEISCHLSVHLVGDPLEGIFHARDHDRHCLWDWGDGTSGSCGGSSSNNGDRSGLTAAATTTTTTRKRICF